MIRSLCTRNRVGVALIFAGAVALVAAAWLIYPPAGVGLSGAFSVFGGYVLLYLEARNAVDRQSAAPD